MVKNIKACLTHNTDDWKTPKDLYNHFISLGFIDCFPFQNNEQEFNQFEQEYENKKLFMNPPFSKLNETADYIIKLADKNEIVLLMPARTDTKYFHKLLSLNPIIYFIKGRLHFNDSKKSAPFPTIILYFHGKRIFPLYFKWFQIKNQK